MNKHRLSVILYYNIQQLDGRFNLFPIKNKTARGYFLAVLQGNKHE